MNPTKLAFLSILSVGITAVIAGNVANSIFTEVSAKSNEIESKIKCKAESITEDIKAKSAKSGSASDTGVSGSTGDVAVISGDVVLTCESTDQIIEDSTVGNVSIQSESVSPF